MSVTNSSHKSLLTNEQRNLLERLVADLDRDAANLEATVERVSVEAIQAAGMAQSSFAERRALRGQDGSSLIDDLKIP